ncbi:tyrosine-type recombinase/integrase [Maridesulfovibrio sp. FT414]|uniref:tyrosine-type recombinase/integrase n=1 Tax=Maridesulfovibrio sp. FT414 TaxID=2979469 RepID=UPI003D806736
MNRIRTKFTGVYQRQSKDKRFDGKPDVCFEITYKTKDRKKIWETIGWKSQGFTATRAHNIRTERLNKVNTGKIGSVQNITYNQAWAMYRDKHLPETSKSKTNDISRHDNHIGPTIGHIALEKLSPDDLQDLKNVLADRLSAQTVKHILGQIRRVINKSIQWGHWDGINPITRISMPSVSNRRTRYLTADEAKTLLDALKQRSFQTYAITAISLHTGMRFGEIAALKWPDINMDASTITVLDAKTGDRHALMTDTVREILVQIPRKSFDGHIFTTVKGDRIQAPSATFERVVAELGFNNGVNDRRQKFVFHSLRHTYASWMATKGVPLYVIAELLGHSTQEMANRYAHLCPDQKRDASNLVQEIFNSAGQ